MITNHHQLANLLHSCIDLSEHPQGTTLLDVIKLEKRCNTITLPIVEEWIRGLPSVCTIPFENHEIRSLLDSANLESWSIDDYWRWAASRIEAFAKHPKAYQ